MPAWLPSVRALFLLFVFAILLISSATTSGWLGGTAAWAGLETTGRWTDTTSAVPWGHMQIHVALMRGERVPPITTGYHSKILSWAAFNTTLGRLEASFWGWNPGGNLADQNCAGYPSSRLTSLSLDLTNIPSLFCAGHATLADGNLLVTGGDDGANVGLWDSYVFRPNPTGGQTRWERM